MTKSELREKMKKVRGALSPAQRQYAAESCAARLAQRAAFDSAERIFCYMPVGSELDTEPIFRMARNAGKEIAFPKVLNGEEMVFMLGRSFHKGYMDIPEPQEGQVVIPAPKDLMLVPGLAFSADGGRIGYGKGYYDRYLARLKARPQCWGLAFDDQMFPSLPTEPTDQLMDYILTPSGIYRCGK